MAQFSKFKLIFAIKQKFNGGEFYKVISKIGYFHELK